jgi:hypothetical protein
MERKKGIIENKDKLSTLYVSEVSGACLTSPLGPILKRPD